VVRSAQTLFDSKLLLPAIGDSFRKLSPLVQLRNPVMFVVYIGALLTSLLWLQALSGRGEAPATFILAIASWLWFTVLFANFAEALAEGRSKAQAASLRGLKQSVQAKKMRSAQFGSAWVSTPAADLRKGDLFLVEAGDVMPADGEVVEGVASVDESAITGESAPVVRESGGDFCAVTGGTRVLSDWLIVSVAVNPGEAFIDRMIAMVEGAKRQKTPNEIALTILLIALTLVFLLATLFSVAVAREGAPVTITVLVALLVCLIPTTIGGLLSAIGVAGMSRMMASNVIATSGRAVEAAGDVDVLLLDKTGTITLGNRQAAAFIPAAGVTELQLADAAQLSSLADETPEGRSIVILAKQRFNLRERNLGQLQATFIPFSAVTRMSGIDMGTREVRKGAALALRKYVEALGLPFPAAVSQAVDEVARKGSTPLVVTDAGRVLGIVELKDIVKGGIKERFGELRRMGIRTVMITGDNRLTAAAIAAEAGVDDFLAEATPCNAQIDSRISERWPLGGDDRRRHQRCAGAGPSRRGGGHEFRYASRQRGGQHGRLGLQPDQAHRDRRGGQATAHHAWSADDVFRGQRCRQIFRHHSRGFCDDVPAARCARRHALDQSRIGDPVGRDLQCAHHRIPDSLGVAGRGLPSARRGGAAAA
jgi:K+-transporting ATPase ATPase B chain